MNSFTDPEAKAACQAECDKRNKHKSKFLAEKAWKPLYTPGIGWKPELKPSLEIERKKRRVLS